MGNSKPKQERTKIISGEEYWEIPIDKKDTFDGFWIEEVSIRYVQHCQGEFQDLIIKTEDNGGGRYISIKTEKFDFNDSYEFEDILKDFKIRAKLKI